MLKRSGHLKTIEYLVSEEAIEKFDILYTHFLEKKIIKMPMLSKKAFALPNKKTKSGFKSPFLAKENIKKIIKTDENVGNKRKTITSSSLNKVEKRKITINKNVSVTLSFEEEPSVISKRMNEPKIKEAYLQQLDRLKNATPTLDQSIEDLLTILTPEKSNSDAPLSQEVLNNTYVKEKYVNFWKENLSEDLHKDFEQFSQEIKKSSNQKQAQPKQKKANISNKGNKPKKIQNGKKTKVSKEKLSAPLKGTKNKSKTQATTEKSIETDPISNIYERMNLIHQSRNVGLYVYCDACSKTRYLPDTKDPLDLPAKWYCFMNPDPKYNECAIPEVQINQEEEDCLVYNLYNTGSIVWAKMDGYPWWPAMVEDDPDTEVYYWLEEGILEPTWYHVTFFDSSEVTRAWMLPSQLKPFKANMKNPEFKVSKFDKYRVRVNAAFNQASDAINLSLLKRLEKYSFISRYRNILKVKKGKCVEGKKRVSKKCTAKEVAGDNTKFRRILNDKKSSDFDDEENEAVDNFLESFLKDLNDE